MCRIYQRVDEQQSWFDFVYDDEDTVMNEIEEFYSYIEMPQVAENLKAWEGSFKAGAPDYPISMCGNLNIYIRMDEGSSCPTESSCRTVA